MKRFFPALDQNSSDPLPCYKALWGYSEICRDCPKIEHFNELQASRTILERRLPNLDEERFLEIISLPVRGENEDVAGLFKIAMDITSTEKRQRALREKEKLFTSIIDTSADAIFFLDNHDRVLSWNQGAEKIFGYAPEEVVGKSSVLLVPQELIELGEQYYIKQELDKNGFLHKFETQRLTKSGQVIYVDLTRTQLHDEKGGIIGSSVILKDITSRKELEFELRRTILELSKFNEMNEILYTTFVLDDILRMILIAITAGEGLRFNRAFILLVDEAQQKLTGHLAVGPANEWEAYRIWGALQEQFRSLKEIVQQFEINLPGSDSQINTIVKEIKISLQDEQNLLIQSLQQRRVTIVREGNADGYHEFNFSAGKSTLPQLLDTDTFVVVPLVSRKEPIGIIIADNKITRRDIGDEELESLKLFAHQASLAIENARLYHHLEDRIAELQEAYRKLEENAGRLVKAERLAVIGEMSAKVAHEIRNPLVSIGGFARLLQRKLPDNSDLKKYTEVISNQVGNLESILSNIMDMARPRLPSMRNTDIHQIIEHILFLMKDVIEKRKVQVFRQFECMNGEVYGDEKLLHQALLNLLKNALEAMPDNGELKVHTQCEPQYVSVELQDSGYGIPQEILDRVYEPFFTTKADGTGLGLAIVKQIMQDHNGEIMIESTPENGTVVRLLIPRSPEHVVNNQ
ncbi:MAG: PAS domain S-box protein [Calditrichia bacterium]